MALEAIGDISDVSLTEQSSATEILSWETEGDWHDAVDTPGMVSDSIADHAGVGKTTDGYHYGSLTDELVAYYKLDEGSGSTAGDATELNNDGTISGATWVTGKIGSNALSFDGTDDYVDTQVNIGNGAGSFSVCGWINPDAVGSQARIFDEDNGSGDRSYITGLGITSGELFMSVYDTSDTGHLFETSSANLSTGTWYHVAFIWNGGTAYIYLNGSLMTSNPVGSMQNSSVTTDLARQNASGFYYPGDLDEPRLFERALSKQEVVALANLTAPSAVNSGDTL